MHLHYKIETVERKRYVLATAGLLGLLGAAALVGGSVAGGMAIANSGKSDSPQVGPAPVLPNLPNAPTPTTAAESAQAAVEKQKRMRALAGGKTLLTSESPTLSSGAGKSLLGS